MLRDRYGNSLTTRSAAARDAYVAAVDRLLSGDAGIEQAFRDTIAIDDGFALAHVGLARALQALGRSSEAQAPLQRAVTLAAGASARERSHVALFADILGGRGAAAIPAILQHLDSWPRDAMVLAPITGVFGLIGFSGQSGRETRQRAVLENLAGTYGEDWWFRTVLAFAQIELHDFDAGQKNIETALRGRPRSAHATHIHSHLQYELGEREAGLAFLDLWSRDYPTDGFLHCHLAWHRAIWSLETGRRAQAWDIYRTALQPGACWGPPLNVLTDGASFLARAGMAGERVDPGLWRAVSDYASAWFPNSGIAFADMHSALAFAMAGDQDALRRIMDSPKGPAADILPAVARGFDAFARGDWAAVVAEVGPVLASHERVGGSRAQRDLLDFTVACALLRQGRAAEAQAHLSGRRPRIGTPLAGS